jgi:glycosyltransferase involved in cell wall biosynthesis
MDIKLEACKWVTNNKDIIISDTEEGIKIEYLSDKNFDYIHYGCVRYFSKYSNNDLFDIKKETTYSISIEGYTDEYINVKLFINTYSKENMLSSNSIDVGSEGKIYTHKNVKSYKVALKVEGKGCVYINKIKVESFSQSDYIKNILNNLSDNKYLLISNIYPSQRDLYRNAFVHRRVKLYKDHGLDVDVYSLDSKGGLLDKYDFEGIEVLRGNYKGLEMILKSKKYEKILIHFVMKDIIEVIDKVCYDTHRIVWIHGFEVSRWQRRAFNYTNEEINKNKDIWNQNDIIKMSFLRSIYTDDRYKFVAVSNWLKSKSCESDAQCKIKNCTVIPNVVDENMFKYNKKNKYNRLKILSIRPFTANNYANDLTVKAILELSKKEFFTNLEFNIYGKGLLFKEITKDIDNFDNINLYEKFITQSEIANLHKEHGIFLCPSRLDTQGVSMCEAMSSGLVCISNDVAAISEYLIDKDCGILAKADDYIGLADAIEYLYYNEHEFLKMSKNASEFIKFKCGIDATIKKELELILEDV